MTTIASALPIGFDATKIELLSGGDATGSVARMGIYNTIQAAINAIPRGTTSTTIRQVYTVVIPPGTYDEALTIDITNRHIELTALGAVNIGLFDNTFWAASNTRNITIVCTAGAVDSIRSTFGMGTYIPYGTSQTTHPSYSTGFRLSGGIIVSTMPAGFADVELYLGAEIWGDVDTSAFATHNFHLYFNRARVRSQVKGTRNRIQFADWCVFDGLVTALAYSTLRDSVFAAGMTVGQSTSGGVKPFGMLGCDFSGTFTGPASSMVLDGTSQYYFTANGAALAGGATQVLLEGGGSSGITQLTGDVTAGPGSGSQAATIGALKVTTGTIAANAVTNAKLATMAANTVKANITGGSAAPTDAALDAAASNNSVAQRTSSADLVATVMRAATHKPIDGAGTAVTFTGGSAASNGAGGNATLSGASGDSTGTGGAGGNATVTGGTANGDGTVDRAGGSVTVNAGASKGSSAGGGFTVNLGTGGAGTGSAGATGGTANINGGTGGIGSATSGAGGNATLKAGTGGAGTAGGNGGTATLNGGTAGGATGGNGGAANVTGGSSASIAGSAGGAVTVAGAGGTGTGTGGAGGSVTVTGGAAGGDNTVNRAGGSITASAGNSKGDSAGAAVTLNAGVGGTGTVATGATGGAQSINAGNGGVGSGTGGAGGTVTISAGAGGNSATPGAGGNIIFRTATTTSLTERFRVGLDGHSTVTGGDLKIATAGNGLDVKGGANCKLGTSVLVAGTVTVSNTSVTANSRIFVTSQVDGGTPGFLRITAKTAATSFVITSSNAADTSTVAWLIVESL